MLEQESLEQVSEELLTSSENGLMTLAAKIYNIIPMEDFRYRPNVGYNRYGWDGGAGEMQMIEMYTELSTRSDGFGINFTTNHWREYYENIRQIHNFMNLVQKSQEAGTISKDVADRFIGEAYFARAYTYMSLARRYGGVPWIDHVQDDEYVPGTENKHCMFLVLPKRKLGKRFCRTAIKRLHSSRNQLLTIVLPSGLPWL